MVAAAQVSEDVCLAGGTECRASAVEFAVDRRTGHAEQFGDLRLGVLAAILHVEQEPSVLLGARWRTRHPLAGIAR